MSDEELPMNRKERRAKFKADVPRERKEEWNRTHGKKGTRKSAASLKPKKREVDQE